jgi:hypothetical protein
MNLGIDVVRLEDVGGVQIINVWLLEHQKWIGFER